MKSDWLWVILGGGIGAFLRYGVGTLLPSTGFNWGTFAVNVLGCFAIGCCWVYFQNNKIFNGAETFVLVGVLGGFTTFSTYALDLLKMGQTGAIKTAALYFLANNLLGLCAVWLGWKIAS